MIVNDICLNGKDAARPDDLVGRGYFIMDDA